MANQLSAQGIRYDKVSGTSSCRGKPDPRKGSPFSPPPPEKPDQNNHHNRDGEVGVLYQIDQRFPVLSEKVSQAGDDAYPKHGAQEIKQQKLAPAHAQNTGQRTRDDPHPGDETGDKDGGSSVARKQFFSASDHIWPDMQGFLISLQKPTPAVETDGKA